MNLQLRIEGPSGSRVQPLGAAGRPLIAGRDTGADIVLPDPERALSRQHLSLVNQGDTVEVTVISASGGAHTSQGPLAPGHKAALRLGDRVELGPWVLHVEAQAEAAPAAVPAMDMQDPLQALLGGAASPESGLDALWRPGAPAPQGPVNEGFWVGAGSSPPPASFSEARSPLDLGPPAGVAGLGIRPAGAQGDAVSAISDFLGPPPAPAAPAVNLGALLIDAPAPSAWLPPPLPAPPPPAPAPRGEDLWDSLRKALVPAAEPAAAAVAPAPVAPYEDMLALPPTPSHAGSGPSLDELLLGLGSGTAAAPPSAPVAEPKAELGIGFDLPLPTPRASPPPAAPGAPVAPAGPAVAPAGEGSAEAALAKGLGIPLPPDMAAADWERLGATVRQLVEGLSQLLSARAALKRELRAHNKTEMPMRDVNPFKSELGLKDVLQQLLFNANRNGKFMPVERAVREAAEDLLTHDLAIIAASRASVQGTVEEFDPQRLMQQFGKKGLIDMVAHANLWRQYEAQYQQQSAHMADWLERLFEDHFVSAYCNEADRLSQQHVPLP